MFDVCEKQSILLHSRIIEGDGVISFGMFWLYLRFRHAVRDPTEPFYSYKSLIKRDYYHMDYVHGYEKTRIR